MIYRLLILLCFLLPLIIAARRQSRPTPRIPWAQRILLSVYRNASIGERIGRIGRPAGMHGDVKFAITSSSRFPFNIHRTRGVVTVGKLWRPNSAGSRPYNGVVTVSASSSHRVTAQVTVRVSDTPPSVTYRPVFARRQMTVHVMENNKVGASLLKLRLRENPPPDLPVDFLVLGPGHRLVTIDAKGVVRARVSFDREIVKDRQWLKVTVMVRVRRYPERFSRARLRLQIEDINDNAPKFLGSRGQTFFVAENATVGTYIGRLRAVDPDMGHNGVVTINPKFTQMPFQVARDGAITLLMPLDREAKATYMLPVVASDGGMPPLTTTSTATVSVQDINDSPPHFVHFPKLLIASCEVASPNSVIGNVQADDADEPPNNEIRYTLWEDAPIGAEIGLRRHSVSLDPVTGDVQFQVLRPDMPCQKKTFNFTVAAFDPGHNQFKVQRMVSLVMTETEKEAQALRLEMAKSKNSSSTTTSKSPGLLWSSPVYLLITICLLVPIVICLLKSVSFIL